MTERIEMEILSTGNPRTKVDKNKDPIVSLSDRQVQMVDSWASYPNVDVTQQEISSMKRVMRLVVERTLDKWTFRDFVSLQPMELPAALVFYLEYHTSKKMTEADIKADLAHYEVYLENVESGKSDDGGRRLKTLKQYEEMIRDEAKRWNEINLHLSSAPVVARAKQCASKEYTDNFSANLSEDEKAELISNSIAETYNYYIWERLRAFGKQYGTVVDNIVTNVLVAASVAWGEGKTSLNRMAVAYNLKDEFDWSLFGKRFEIIFPEGLRKDTIILTNKAHSFLEAGFIFSPYTICAGGNPWNSGEFILDTKTPGLITRFGIKPVSEWKYATLTVQDNSLFEKV